jgi:hypothetical protein
MNFGHSGVVIRGTTQKMAVSVLSDSYDKINGDKIKENGNELYASGGLSSPSEGHFVV